MFCKTHHNVDLSEGIHMIRFKYNSFGKNTSEVKFELPIEPCQETYDVSFSLVGDATFDQEINFENQLGS